MSVEETIRQKLTVAFLPVHLEVMNESHRHSVPKGSETHFKLVVVSRVFEDLRLLQRHQKVNAVLASELKGGLHALSMETLTPKEWRHRDGQLLESPPCLGGGKAAG